MSKIGLIIGREYFTRVKKKSFLLTTILVPLAMLAFYAVIIGIAVSGGKDQQKIAVIDEASLFSDSSLSNRDANISFSLILNETEQSYVNKYKGAGYSSFLYIPKFNLDSPVGFKLHSTSNASITTTGTIEDIINEAVVSQRLKAQGIDEINYKKISANVKVKSTLDTKEGSRESVAGVGYIISFACGMLIYLMMIIYGTQVMRGVTEEKTNRIAEVVVSSVKPFQLMMGKILGIGAVGLTQFSIWIVLALLGQALIPLFFPEIIDQISNVSNTAEATSMAATISKGVSALPLLKIGLSFLFYFLGGYLTYASLFAAVGSVVSEDQQEAQQLMFPILMPIIVGFVIMMQAVNEPNSTLAVFGSIFPLTSPIVMMGRITYEIPFWQMALSMILLVACFLMFTWLTAKIYRVGILMYGKKPSWKEMAKWAFRKDV